MGEFSITHLVLILIVVLIFFGPGRLPGLGKSLGEAIRGFKKGLDVGPETQQQPPPPPAAPHHTAIQSPRDVGPMQLSGEETQREHQPT